MERVRLKTKSHHALAGNVVERMTKPIARALRLSCLDGKGELKPASPCGKRKAALNSWHAKLLRWLFDASVEEQSRRKDICRQCEHSVKHATAKTSAGLPLVMSCKVGGFKIGVEAKRRKAKCPLDKWNPSHYNTP